MHKKHFVFDLDDTLIDGRQFCGEAMARTITHFEKEVAFDKVIAFHERVRGETIVDLYLNAIKEFNLKTPVDKLLKHDGHIQITEHDKIKLFQGVVEILDFLKANGKQLHICTNRKSETLLPILQNTGILGYFDRVVSCIDAGYKKPEPTCLEEIISKSGDARETFIYFGDSEIDSRFAQNAGVDFIIFDQYMNERNLFAKLINMFLENKIASQDTRVVKSKKYTQKTSHKSM